MNSSPQKRRSSIGISLIETVVSVAIVCVLATLLTSAVQGVRDAGNATKCVANLRQIQQLSAAWSVENDGWVPQAMWSATNLPVGASNLRNFGLTDKLLKCPTSKLKTPNYGISGRLIMNSGAPQWGVGDVQFWNRGRVKMSSLSPRTIMFADSGPESAGRQTGAYFTGIDTIAFPHKGRANIVYVDGHVECLSLKDLNPPGSEPADVWKYGIQN